MKWVFFLVLRLKSIIYYYDHYWLEYLSYGPISGYGIIEWTFSFLFLTYFIRIQKALTNGFFWFQTVKRWILNFYCRRDSDNLFIRYFTSSMMFIHRTHTVNLTDLNWSDNSGFSLVNFKVTDLYSSKGQSIPIWKILWMLHSLFSPRSTI